MSQPAVVSADHRAEDVALIGCGAIMELAHAPALAALPELCQVRAVVDTVRSRRDLLGDQFGVPAGARFASVEEFVSGTGCRMLSIVAVPTPAVAGAVRGLTAAGLPVLAEKPLATSAAGARALGGDIRVVHNYLYRAEIRQAIALVGAGAIGQPRFIRLERPDPGHFPGRGAQPDWRLRDAAGCLVDNAYHWVYVAEALARSPVSAVTAQSSVPAPGCPSEDLAVMLLRHDNDVLSCVQAAWCAREAQPVFEAHGTEGSLSIVDGRCVLTPRGQADDARPAHREPSYVALYRDVLTSAQRGERAGASLAECTHVLCVLDAAYRSAAEGVTVQMAGASQREGA